MTNSKSTKRALLLSALSVLMCVAMLVGTTFAWFTDTASTAVNKIQAGTLKVALVDKESGASLEGTTLKFMKAANAPENEQILWEPGCRYQLMPFCVKNEGNLALKYSIQVTGINGDAKLNEAIEWTFEGMDDGVLLPGEASGGITISGHMKEEAGNEYQGLSIDGIAITVYATQYTYEYDSYNNQYDADAPFLSFWNGNVGTVPALVDGKRHITNADEFAAVMAATTAGNSGSLYVGETLVLDCDIDFGGRTISGIGGYKDNVAFTFDGNGHTLQNFVINGKDDAHKEPQADGSIEYRYAGLFQQFNGTVKDLTVKNATIIGDQMVGVIASNVDTAGVIENCKVFDSTVIGAKKVAAITGYTAGGTVTGCEATNVNVYCADEREAQSGEIVGYVNTNSTVSGNTATDVNVYRGSVFTATTTADLGSTLATDGAKAVFLTPGTSYSLPTYINGEDVIIIGNGAEANVPGVIENFNRIYSTGATFVDVVFKDEGILWFKDAAKFIGCTFNGEISNAEPVVGTVSFESCTFNKPVLFAPASESGVPVAGKFFDAKNCIFNDKLTLQGFENVTLSGCTLKGNTWAGTNMISYCPVTFTACSLPTGVSLSRGMSAADVTCIGCNITVQLPA